jgi:hypothetical protein
VWERRWVSRDATWECKQSLATRVTKANSHHRWSRVWERWWVSRDATWECKQILVTRATKAKSHHRWGRVLWVTTPGELFVGRGPRPSSLGRKLGLSRELFENKGQCELLEITYYGCRSGDDRVEVLGEWVCSQSSTGAGAGTSALGISQVASGCVFVGRCRAMRYAR